jgi:hypothetical protein
LFRIPSAVIYIDLKTVLAVSQLAQRRLPFEVNGATGPKATIVNGTYTPTEERLNGKTVYSKLGDDSKCLYFATDKTWIVTNTTAAKEGKLAGFAHTEAGLSHPTLAKQWNVFDGEAWQPQTLKASVMVSHCELPYPQTLPLAQTFK